MRVLVVPDSFTGTLTAGEAAMAIAEGWQESAKSDEISKLALSDGGPGFIAAMLTSTNYQEQKINTSNLIGEPIEISIAVSNNGKEFFIESAQIVGSEFVASDEQKKPDQYTSYGIGEAVKKCIELGAQKIVIGLGGTASIDGGAGMIAALGAQPKELLDSGGLKLKQLKGLDLSVPIKLLENIDLIVAADVDVPLLGSRGAAMGFGAQKGASPELQTELESSLTHYSDLFPVRNDGKHPAVMLGAGAAGGIGFAALALGGKKVAGFEFVAQAFDLPTQISKCDLVITGEGKFDWQSLQGKAIAQLAQLTLSFGKPLLVLAGQVDVGRREWSTLGIVGAYSCSEDGEIPVNPKTALRDLAARVAKTFSPTSWQN